MAQLEPGVLIKTVTASIRNVFGNCDRLPQSRNQMFGWGDSGDDNERAELECWAQPFSGRVMKSAIVALQPLSAGAGGY